MVARPLREASATHAQPATPARGNLAYVVNTLNPGGTEKLVVEMSLAFARDYHVVVLCLDEPGTWAATLRQRGIAVHCLWRQPGMDLSMPVKLAHWFKREAIQVVHAHQCTPWFYAALSRLLYPTPRLLLEEHGRFYPEVKNWPRAFVNRLLIRRLTHRFIAVSADIRARLETYEGLDSKQIQVIYNGVAVPPPLASSERAELRAGLGLGPSDFVVGTVGRFDSIKNLPMLVDSLATAHAQVPQLRGLLVGDGPVFGAIRELIAARGMSKHIHLTGFRQDASRLTQCMDLFVLSSFSEGTSMALLEAMAVGVPAAVTAVGGNPEIVLNGSTGWTVPSGDVAALTRVFLTAARDAEQRRAFASAGQDRYLGNFTAQGMIEKYQMQYQQLLGATPVSTGGA